MIFVGVSKDTTSTNQQSERTEKNQIYEETTDLHTMCFIFTLDLN